MVDQMEAVVEALSGKEIIDDVVGHIVRKLQRDCNLRDSDAYGQGYSGTVKISLSLHAMDNTPVEYEIDIPAKFPPPESTATVTVTPVTVEETIEIPQELDLEAVRERIKLVEPQQQEPTEGQNAIQRVKRQYKRRVALDLERTPMGGAVDVE